MKNVCCLLPFLLTGCVAAVPLAVGGTTVIGTTAMEERGIDGAFTDASIRTRINYEWSQSPRDYQGIEITVYNGSVILTGPVKSEQDQKEAVRLARFAPGVRYVFDATKIGGESNYFADAWITTKMHSILVGDARIASHNYTVKTYDSILYLMGTAQDDEEKQAVLEVADNITGVRNVVDFIEVKGHTSPLYSQHENITYQPPCKER